MEEGKYPISTTPAILSHSGRERGSAEKLLKFTDQKQGITWRQKTGNNSNKNTEDLEVHDKYDLKICIGMKNIGVSNICETFF